MSVKVFLCYAQEDEDVLKGLVAHLGALKRQGFLDDLYSREVVSAGLEYAKEIDKYLNTAQIILLIVSPDFMNSDYCFLDEMKHAIERHERGEARVIPIILRPVYYEKAPFAKLQPLPKNRKPVLGSSWHFQDEAFFEVAEGVRKAIEELSSYSRLMRK